MLFKKIISILKLFFYWRYERSTKGSFEGFLECGSWVKLLGIRQIVQKIDYKKVKYGCEVSCCYVPNMLDSNFPGTVA